MVTQLAQFMENFTLIKNENTEEDKEKRQNNWVLSNTL